MPKTNTNGYLGRRIRRWSLPLQRRYVELITKHARRGRNTITALELDELDYLSRARKRLGYPISARERRVNRQLAAWMRSEFRRRGIKIGRG